MTDLQRPKLDATACNLQEDEDNPVDEEQIELEDWDADEFLFIGSLRNSTVEIRISRKEVELMLSLPTDLSEPNPFDDN